MSLEAWGDEGAYMRVLAAFLAHSRAGLRADYLCEDALKFLPRGIGAHLARRRTEAASAFFVAQFGLLLRHRFSVAARRAGRPAGEPPADR